MKMTMILIITMMTVTKTTMLIITMLIITMVIVKKTTMLIITMMIQIEKKRKR